MKTGDDGAKASIAAASKLSLSDQGATVEHRESSKPSAELGECMHQQEETTFLAFFRGVNVGSHNRLPMAELRTLLFGLGYESVQTHLQSGNAIFKAPADTSPEDIAQSIQIQIETKFGLAVTVIVRTKSDLEDVIVRNPLGIEAEKDGSKFLVLFLSEQIASLQQALAGGNYLPERIAFRPRELYVWCPNGVAAAKHGPSFWEKKLGVVGTARNWNTVTKLLELAGK